MAITYNLKNDIRYNQGRQEGIEEGLQMLAKATTERNAAIVRNLLTRNNHSDEEIAQIVNVSVDFVKGLKNNARPQ